jgi:AcrR family transcriptional regulator
MADTLRERKKDRTKLALQSAAVRLFNEKGYAGTSVDDIAEEAEVSRRTFFRYFGSKEGVLFADAEESGNALREEILRQPPDMSGLLAFGCAVVALARHVEEEDQILAQQRVLASSFELRSRAAELARVWRRRLADALAERKGREEADEKDLLTASIGIAVIQSVTEDWVLSDGRDRLADKLEAAFALVTN